MIGASSAQKAKALERQNRVSRRLNRHGLPPFLQAAAFYSLGSSRTILLKWSPRGRCWQYQAH